jgi:predicted nucleic acid-binding protein
VIVVSDTTAITSLLKINRAELLRDLFGQVLVPEGVRDDFYDITVRYLNSCRFAWSKTIEVSIH